MAEAEKCPRCGWTRYQFRQGCKQCTRCNGWRAMGTEAFPMTPDKDRRDKFPGGRRATDQPTGWREGVPEENGLYWRSFSGFVCLVRREDERWFHEHTGPDDFFFPIEDMKFWRIEKPEPHSGEEA